MKKFPRHKKKSYLHKFKNFDGDLLNYEIFSVILCLLLFVCCIKINHKNMRFVFALHFNIERKSLKKTPRHKLNLQMKQTKLTKKDLIGQ